MALQELSPQPAVVGPALLGSVIANAGADYLQRNRQLADQERARANQLADVASTRQYADTRFDVERSRMLADEEKRMQYQRALAGVQMLVQEGLLDGSMADPTKPENIPAIQAAYKQAHEMGLDKIYKDLLETPGKDGKPLLTPEDVIAPDARLRIQAAKGQLNAIKAGQLKFQLDQPANAQATVDQLNQQLAAIRAQKEQVVREANQPAPQYQPNDPQVAQLASQLAEQQKPGSGRNRESIAAQIPAALKQLNDQAFIAWNQQTQSAKIELESLRRSEAELTNSLERAMSTFRVAPSNSATLAAPQPTAEVAAPSAPKVASAEDIAAAMRAVVGGSDAPDEPGVRRPILLENPTNNSTIAEGNAEIQRRASAQTQAQLNAAIADGATIEKQLAAAPQGALASAPIIYSAGSPGASPVTLAKDRVFKATAVADLLKQKAANDAKVKALQAQLMGPAPATVSAPAVNTPTASTPSTGYGTQGFGAAPEWWRTGVGLPGT